MENMWTQEELSEFDRLTKGTGSLDQLTRISCRLDLTKFIQKHGEAKCDAMFKFLTK